MLPSGICNDAVRVGGFGPMFAGHHLTSCFNDVVLVPLPTWLLILFAPVILATSHRPVHHHGDRVRSGLFSRIISVIYHILVLAALLMEILEVTRLALSHSGIGLLPFTLAGILIAMGLLFARKRQMRSPRAIGGLLAVYWGLLVAFQAVKVNTLVYVEKIAKQMGSKGPSMYPNSDKSLDNYVILGLYAVLFLYELFHLSRRHDRTQAVGVAEGHNYNGSNNTGDELVGGKHQY